MAAIKLRESKSKRITGPGIVTGDALGPARKVPCLFALAARGLRINNRENAVLGVGREEGRVGLFVVPFIRVAVPGGAVEVQNLRFQPALTAPIAALHLQKNGLGQNAVLWKKDLTAIKAARNRHRAVVDPNRCLSRNGNQALGRRMVCPLRRVDRKRKHTGSGNKLLDGSVQSGLA